MLRTLTSTKVASLVQILASIVIGASALISILFLMNRTHLLSINAYTPVLVLASIAFAIFLGLSSTGQGHRIANVIEAGYAAIGISFALLFLVTLTYIVSKHSAAPISEVATALHIVASLMLSVYIFPKWKQGSEARSSDILSPHFRPTIDEEPKSPEASGSKRNLISLIANATINIVTLVGLGLFTSYRAQRPAVRDLVAFLLLTLLVYVSTFAIAITVISAFGAAAALVFGSALVGLSVMLGVAIGAIALGLALRAAASLRHPMAGFRSLPDNWIEATLLTDLFHTPELMPSASKVSREYSISGLLETSSNLAGGFQKGASYLLIAALYLSSITYRCLIKGTCWIWWPVALSASQRFRRLRQQPARLRAHMSYGLLGVSAILTRASIAFLLLSIAYQVLIQSKALLGVIPKETADSLAALTTAGIVPDSGLRLCFFIGTVGALAIYWWLAQNTSVAFENPLKSPKEFSELAALDRELLIRTAGRAERARLVSLALTICFLELQLIHMISSRFPEMAHRYLGGTLLSVL